MKRIVGLPFLLGFFVTTVYAQELAKKPARTMRDVPVYEYSGLIHSQNNLWMRFEIFAGNNSKIEAVCVLPENFNIKLREGEAKITALDADFSDSSCLAFAITLLVPNEQDLESWNGYLTKLERELKTRGVIEGARLDFVNGEGGVITIATHIKNTKLVKDLVDWPEDIFQVRVNLQDIAVKLDQELQSNNPIFEVEWGLCHIVKRQSGMVLSKDYIKAPKLVICVKNEALLEEWNNRIRDWQDKIRPHRVLPPKN